MTQDKSALNEAQIFAEFCHTISRLRDPDTGCPWDLKQTHRTLRQYMIEEAYEAAAEMEGEATPELCDELGDVLLQVVLNAQLASEAGAFSIFDVVKMINDKMIRRHPHVFDPEGTDRDEASIKRNWERIKEEEKRQEKTKSYFSKSEKVQPSLSKANSIGKQAAKIAFDWSQPEQVIDKLLSEIDELKQAIGTSDARRTSRIEDELGDVIFTVAQLARHLGVDPETAAHHGNEKFLQRFKKLEELAAASGVDVTTALTRSTPSPTSTMVPAVSPQPPPKCLVTMIVFKLHM